MDIRHASLHSLLATVGHRSRFRIVLTLTRGARCVSDLALAVELSQSCTTRHVQALQAAGVVRSVRDGKRVLVQLDFERSEIASLLGWLGAAVPAKPLRAREGSRARTRPKRAPRSARSDVGRRTEGPRPTADPATEAAHDARPESVTHAGSSEGTDATSAARWQPLEDFLL